MSLMINLAYSHPDPMIAAEVANLFAKEFIDLNGESLNMMIDLESTGKPGTPPLVFQAIGQTILQQQIEKGWSALEIKKSWQKDLEQFKILRANYLLYP